MEVIAVEMTDQPGALHTVTDCLFKNAINVDNTSGFVANHHAVLVVEVHDVARASEVLQRQGLHVLTQDETLAI